MQRSSPSQRAASALRRPAKPVYARALDACQLGASLIKHLAALVPARAQLPNEGLGCGQRMLGGGPAAAEARTTQLGVERQRPQEQRLIRVRRVAVRDLGEHIEQGPRGLFLAGP